MNKNPYTHPVRKMRNTTKAHIEKQLVEISEAHGGVPYELVRSGGMWRIMVGHLPCHRVDIVTRSNRGPYLVVSGVEWKSPKS